MEIKNEIFARIYAMSKKEAKQKVEVLLETVLSNPKYAEEIAYLQRELDVTKEHIIASWIYWDFAIQTYSNEVYSSEALRLVMHLHNCLKGSWHEKRQEIISVYLRKVAPQSICEIGFGVPQKYVKEFLATENVRMCLGDYEQSSLTFAKKLLTYWNTNWEQKIKLMIFDLNIDTLPKNYDVFVFQDSIEHADNPSEILQKYTDSAHTGTYFIFSLPIEVKNSIPEHNICWQNEQEALAWVKNAGLNILAHSPIQMDKDIDLFAGSLHIDFREVAILARKF